MKYNMILENINGMQILNETDENVIYYLENDTTAIEIRDDLTYAFVWEKQKIVRECNNAVSILHEINEILKTRKDEE